MRKMEHRTLSEEEWDAYLRIHTCGREDYQEDQAHFPYEPTPYIVLEKLCESGYLTSKDKLLDYGCGKGRVVFFLSGQTGCEGIGIEYDEKLYTAALENLRSGGYRNVNFFHADAESFDVLTDVTRCFFFNPFSEPILRRVLDRIRSSFIQKPSELYLFFYYLHDEHLSLLMTREELMFTDEIDCSTFFPGRNKRERILIFEVAG